MFRLNWKNACKGCIAHKKKPTFKTSCIGGSWNDSFHSKLDKVSSSRFHAERSSQHERHISVLWSWLIGENATDRYLIDTSPLTCKQYWSLNTASFEIYRELENVWCFGRKILNHLIQSQAPYPSGHAVKNNICFLSFVKILKLSSAVSDSVNTG